MLLRRYLQLLRSLRSALTWLFKKFFWLLFFAKWLLNVDCISWWQYAKAMMACHTVCQLGLIVFYTNLIVICCFRNRFIGLCLATTTRKFCRLSWGCFLLLRSSYWLLRLSFIWARCGIFGFRCFLGFVIRLMKLRNFYNLCANSMLMIIIFMPESWCFCIKHRVFLV